MQYIPFKFQNKLTILHGIKKKNQQTTVNILLTQSVRHQCHHNITGLCQILYTINEQLTDGHFRSWRLSFTKITDQCT